MYNTKTLLLACISVALLSGTGAVAYELPWFTIDGGGVQLRTGGDYELSGTIGQHDATVTVMTGGSYELTGGFWVGSIAGTEIPGDCNGDNDVDLDDFETFAICLAGPGGSADPGCECADFDGDGDVDLNDFGSFQQAFEE